MSQSEQPPAKQLTFGRRCLRWLKRVCFFVLACLAFYFFVVLIGLIPVNNDFRPTPDGVEVLLVSSSIHADIILPIKNESIDWRERFPAKSFSSETGKATHVAIGWGDKGFYIGTPTWSDLRASTAAKAMLWSSESCMHVSMRTLRKPPEDAISVRISAEQYERLVEHINQGFQRDDAGALLLIPDAAYTKKDAFFESHGSYHCFNTCNCWVGGALRAAGIRTGWFTPLPKTPFLYLKNEMGQ